jgi:hypothetical protein
MWALENGRTQFWSIKAQSGSSRGENMFKIILLLIVTPASPYPPQSSASIADTVVIRRLTAASLGVTRIRGS